MELAGGRVGGQQVTAISETGTSKWQQQQRMILKYTILLLLLPLLIKFSYRGLSTLLHHFTFFFTLLCYLGGLQTVLVRYEQVPLPTLSYDEKLTGKVL